MISNQKQVHKQTVLLWLTTIFVLPLLVFAGCGSGSGIPLSDVSGSITIDGAPAVGAGVRFSPKSGERTSTGQVGQDGKYRLIFSPKELGAVIGEHEVIVQYKGKLLSKEVVVEDSNTSTINLELNEFKKAKQ